MEAAKDPCSKYIAEQLLQLATSCPEVAEKILKQKKTLAGALDAIKAEAKKHAVGGCGCVDEAQAEIKKLKLAKEAAEAKAEADHKLTRKTEEKLAKVSRKAEELSMQLAGAAESKKIAEAMSTQRDVLEHEAEELRKSLYNREQETAILEERIKELEEQLKQPVTVATKTEIVEKIPEAVMQELEELRSKLAESENDAGAQKEALELKVEIWAVLNGINKLLEHLDKVQDGKRGAGVCKALASALAQSQNQITKRLAKFEQEG